MLKVIQERFAVDVTVLRFSSDWKVVVLNCATMYLFGELCKWINLEIIFVTSLLIRVGIMGVLEKEDKMNGFIVGVRIDEKCSGRKWIANFLEIVECVITCSVFACYYLISRWTPWRDNQDYIRDSLVFFYQRLYLSLVLREMLLKRHSWRECVPSTISSLNPSLLFGACMPRFIM